MRGKLSILLAFLLTFTNLLWTNNIAFADSSPPDIPAQYAVLMDYESGQVLYEKNGHDKMYPASTTKMWTAYVVLKHAKDLNEYVTITIDPVEGSSMYLRKGEKFTIKELLQGLMITSGNDAAVVLAQHMGDGSIEKFVDLMNKEAAAIGAKNTHFNNPSGLPDDQHYTTAYDMALMSRKAMSNATFREIVSTKVVKFPVNENRQIAREFINSNKFLTGSSNHTILYNNQHVPVRYDIVDGIKTGYTDAAGNCLLSSARKNDMRLISAVFKNNGDQTYISSRTLLDYGFENFKSQTAINKEDYIDSEKIWYTKERKLNYAPESNYYTVINKNEDLPEYRAESKLDDLELPIKKGDKVGFLEIYKDKESKPVAKIKLIAQNDVNNLFVEILKNPIVKMILNLLLILILALLLFVIFVIVRKKARRSMRIKKRNIYSKKRRGYSNSKSIYSNKRRRR
ncbi:MAG: D-alanyl-D-alanine carboxypeptidase family protein [Paraclostridium sp.]